MSSNKIVIFFISFCVLVGVATVAIIGSSNKQKSKEPVSVYVAEKAGGVSYGNTEIKIAKKYPMISELPVENVLFRIGYGLSPTKKNDPSAYAIFVTLAKETYKSYVIEWMTLHNYNPNDYEMIYKIDPSYGDVYVSP